jgi:hypothetical protein
VPILPPVHVVGPKNGPSVLAVHVVPDPELTLCIHCWGVEFSVIVDDIPYGTQPSLLYQLVCIPLPPNALELCQPKIPPSTLSTGGNDVVPVLPVNVGLLSFDEFDDLYREVGQIDTWHKNWDRIVQLNKEKKIWTAVDSDGDSLCYISGIHYVNRLYYVIAENPHEATDDKPIFVEE